MLSRLIRDRDVEGIRAYMAEYDLVVRNNKIVPRDDSIKKVIKEKESFWNSRQQAKKILLNSLYGALLNEACRFYDGRVGQSVTLSGRSIARHMNAKINEIITQVFDHTGDAIQYADTDSAYFSGLILKDMPEWREQLFAALHENEKATVEDPTQWVYGCFDFNNRNHIIKLYDDISDIVNDSFPPFMVEAFNTSLERGAIIKGGRELVASSCLFIKKKKYAALMYEKDGKRFDIPKKGENEPSPGKLKVMGLDLKRADTPKIMQQFLERLLLKILTDHPLEEMFDDIKVFRRDFKSRPPWEKGTPKKVSNLSEYGWKLNRATSGDIYNVATGRVNLPEHVAASLTWNRLCEINKDMHSLRITDGSRIVVCKLIGNSMKIRAIAYPIDEPHLPDWFKELPFDEEIMEETIVDKKLSNLVDVLNWNLALSKEYLGDEFFSF